METPQYILLRLRALALSGFLGVVNMPSAADALAQPGDGWARQCRFVRDDPVVEHSHDAGAFVVSGDGGIALASLDGLVWETSPPWDISERQALTCGRGITVRVGPKGSIKTSTDGLSWIGRASQILDNLHGVAFGRGLFVAVGNEGALLTSPDGLAWTKRNARTDLRLRGVAYGNGRFVVVGYEGTVLVSRSGRHWSSCSSGIHESLLGVAYGRSLFVAVGWNGVLLTSSDGVTWTRRVSGTSSHLLSISFSKSSRYSAKLLVISPEAFSQVLQPLAAHKNSTGMPTRLLSIEQIRTNFPGRDDPERLKYAIESAHRRWGVRYVFLVGDASLLPVRYRQVEQVLKDAPLDGTYNPSELYYANLYQGHVPGNPPEDPRSIKDSGLFDTWDADGNGRFDEQHWKDDAVSYNPDRVDGCPDIASGRLPAHTAQEVRNYVAKLIRYESGDFKPINFEHFTFIADKAYGGSQQLCDDIINDSILPACPKSSVFERLYLNCASDEYVGAPWRRGSFAAIDAAASSSWWITYLGHAGPRNWAIHENGSGYDDDRVARLSNMGALPIIFSIGCESGMFMSYAPSEAYRDQNQCCHKFVWHAESRTWDDEELGQRLKAPLAVPQPYAYDFAESSNRTFACSWLMSSTRGAIAFFGETLVCEDDKGHDLEKELFLRYRAGGRILGELWLYGQRKYWLNNRTSENVFRHPRIYLGIMTLFGDPSLRLPLSAGSGK